MSREDPDVVEEIERILSDEGIQFLLAHGADPNRMTGWRLTALHQAVRRDNAVENIEAFASGPTGVTALVSKAGTVDEKRAAMAAWFTEVPKTFAELRPVSTDGGWLEPLEF